MRQSKIKQQTVTPEKLEVGKWYADTCNGFSPEPIYIRFKRADENGYYFSAQTRKLYTVNPETGEIPFTSPSFFEIQDGYYKITNEGGWDEYAAVDGDRVLSCSASGLRDWWNRVDVIHTDIFFSHGDVRISSKEEFLEALQVAGKVFEGFIK